MEVFAVYRLELDRGQKQRDKNIMFGAVDLGGLTSEKQSRET